MRITKSAARELIRSEYALTKGLPSEEFLDETMQVLRAYEFWQLSDEFCVTYTPPRNGGDVDFDQPEIYELVTY